MPLRALPSAVKLASTEDGMALADKELFLEASWVDGRPLSAADGAVLAVTNPATGETVGRVPALGARGGGAGDRSRGARTARMARAHREGARGRAAALVGAAARAW